jgi:PhoH-like ATPase
VAAALAINSDAVVLVTKDINLRVKCDALGIKTEDYNSERVVDDISEIYTGCCDIDVTNEQLEAFIANGFLLTDKPLFENQYVFLKGEGQKKSSLARFSDGKLLPLIYHKDVWGVNPRNREQTFALDALFNPNINLVTLVGRAGSGKTLLAVTAGISQVFDKHVYSKLVIAKPTVSLGKQHDVGFLPGTLQEKLDPWLASIWDNMNFLFGEKGKVMIESYIESGQIELCSLQHIRGRSIRDAFIIIDEAQNLTKHEVKSILTRAGEGTRVCLTSDLEQIDSVYITSHTAGVTNVIEAFKGQKLAAHLTLKRGERSELATLASQIL